MLRLLVLFACLAAGPVLAGAAAKAAKVDPPKGVPACPSGEDAPDLKQLLGRTEKLMDGNSSISVMEMAITTPQWKRTLKMKVWTKGRDYALIRIEKGGPRETGMMTLKREKQLWNYLPQAGRVMKLPSGMLGDSWMGSDFTNDDLVKGSSLTTDYDAKVEKTVEEQGRKAWLINLIPRKDSTVVWGRVELVLDRDTCVPLVQRFYDEDGVLARSMEFSDIQQVGWRAFPKKMVIIPAEKGRKTVMTYEDVQFDVDVPDDTFSLRRLQSGHD